MYRATRSPPSDTRIWQGKDFTSRFSSIRKMLYPLPQCFSAWSTSHNIRENSNQLIPVSHAALTHFLLGRIAQSTSRIVFVALSSRRDRLMTSGGLDLCASHVHTAQTFLVLARPSRDSPQPQRQGNWQWVLRVRSLALCHPFPLPQGAQTLGTDFWIERASHCNVLRKHPRDRYFNGKGGRTFWLKYLWQLTIQT